MSQRLRAGMASGAAKDATSGREVAIEMTKPTKNGPKSGRELRRRSRKERLLIWLQGEELFDRSSPLEQNITYTIFSILLFCLCFTLLHSWLFGGACVEHPRLKDAARKGHSEAEQQKFPVIDTVDANYLRGSGEKDV